MNEYKSHIDFLVYIMLVPCLKIKEPCEFCFAMLYISELYSVKSQTITVDLLGARTRARARVCLCEREIPVSFKVILILSLNSSR